MLSIPVFWEGKKRENPQKGKQYYKTKILKQILFHFFLEVNGNSINMKAPKYIWCIHWPQRAQKRIGKTKTLPPSIRPQPINKID